MTGNIEIIESGISPGWRSNVWSPGSMSQFISTEVTDVAPCTDCRWKRGILDQPTGIGCFPVKKKNSLYLYENKDSSDLMRRQMCKVYWLSQEQLNSWLANWKCFAPVKTSILSHYNFIRSDRDGCKWTIPLATFGEKEISCSSETDFNTSNFDLQIIHLFSIKNASLCFVILQKKMQFH